jgi:tRNA threonylcarbamoyladenosine biosynthesis protein TsaE
MKFVSCNLNDTRILARDILASLGSKNIILLEGELGAGKTTLAQGILEELGAEGPFTSPTFVVMKDYDLSQNGIFKKVYHFDCYRIGAEDLKDLSWEETIEDKNNLVIVEWPNRIESALVGKEVMNVEIGVINENRRKFIIKNN